MRRLPKEVEIRIGLRLLRVKAGRTPRCPRAVPSGYVLSLAMLLAACGSSGGGGPGAAGSNGTAGSSGGAGTSGVAGTGTPGAAASGGTSGTAGGGGQGGDTGNAGRGGTTGGTSGSAGAGAGGRGGVQGTGGGAGSGGSGGASGSAGNSGAAGAGGRGGAAGAAGTGGAAGRGGGGSSGGSTGGSTCTAPSTPTPSGMDWVNGSLVTINDNGAWTWYSDERAVVDTTKGKLIVTSDANAMGPGGSGRDGNVDAVIWDLATRTGSRTVLGDLNPDDHNNAGLLVRPDGNYLAMYAGHNQDCRSYWRNYVNNAWTAQQSFDWVPLGCDTSVNTKVTYSNPWNMTAESNKIYAFVRSIGTSPNALVSTDQGMTWTYGGRLTKTPQVGYVAGYYKYWGNGVDRIDFLATEAHPRDFDNSLYHGYLKGGKTYNSADMVIDASLSDNTQAEITAFTKVFATGTTINGVRLHHAWNSDIMRYDDGTIAIIWKARVGTDTNNPDHRLMYGRWDGTSWKLTYLGKAGPKLYPDEQDYIGLGSLHPDDPRTIYISTTVDPRNDTTSMTNHEIFQGTTCDGGATFQWTPITANSTRKNLRPIVPKWDSSHTALLWFRGSYTTAQQYNMAVVGVVSPL